MRKKNWDRKMKGRDISSSCKQRAYIYQAYSSRIQTSKSLSVVTAGVGFTCMHAVEANINEM